MSRAGLITRSNHPKHAWTSRAGGGHEISGLAVQSQIAQQREGDGLLGVTGEEKLVKPPEADIATIGGELVAEGRHEPGMMNSTARSNDLRRRRHPRLD